MRATLRGEWPLLTYLYNIRPDNYEGLSTAELNEYRRQAAEWASKPKG